MCFFYKGVNMKINDLYDILKNYPSIDNFIRNIETGNQELTEMR